MVEAEERANGTIWMMDLRIEVNNIVVVSKKWEEDGDVWEL